MHPSEGELRGGGSSIYMFNIGCKIKDELLYKGNSLIYPIRVFRYFHYGALRVCVLLDFLTVLPPY